MDDSVSSTSRGRRLTMATLRSVAGAGGLAAALALTGCGSSGPADSASTDTSPSQGISDNDGERGPIDVGSFCAEIAGNTEFLSGYDVVSQTADPTTEVRIICGTVGDSEPIVPFVNLCIGADRLPGGPEYTPFSEWSGYPIEVLDLPAKQYVRQVHVESDSGLVFSIQGTWTIVMGQEEFTTKEWNDLANATNDALQARGY